MVLLDCEVAWYGDPAFDLAFMLNHFFLKALRHAPRDTGMRRMIDSFWSAYQGLRSTPGVAGDVFYSLKEADVNVLMISQGASKINVAFVVEDADCPKAVQALHRKFFGA